MDGASRANGQTPGTLLEPDWDAAVRCVPLVRSFASGLTSDPHEADELVQETLLRLSSRLSAYRPGNFEGWLYRVTRNVFLDRCRRRGRLREESVPDESGPDVGGRVEPSASNPVEEAGERSEIRRVVWAAIMRLPYDMRMAVVLCDIEGLTYREIGEAVGISLGTVRSRTHRARRRLRVLLAAYFHPR